VRCSPSIGWLGLLTNTALLFMKAFVGLVSGSQAMLADAMYSLKDVITSLLVIVGLTVSEKPLDRKHPYGHGKIEFILALMASAVFLAVTAFLFIYSIGTLVHDQRHTAPHPIALWGALLSIAVNVFMYYYSRCVSIETNSPMVKTLAHHHHADASSSCAVAAGILLSNYFGLPWIDTLVAMFETLHLLYLGAGVFKEACHGLMDRGADKPLCDAIGTAAASVEGVKRLRTRHVGQEIYAEVVVGVDPEISLNEAHRINEAIKDRIRWSVSHIGWVQVTTEANDRVGGEHGGLREYKNDPLIRAAWNRSRRVKERTRARRHNHICVRDRLCADLSRCHGSAGSGSGRRGDNIPIWLGNGLSVVGKYA
jgi:cation diffusion facilitator family transporter